MGLPLFLNQSYYFIFYFIFRKVYAAYSIIAPNGLQHTENLLKSYNHHFFKKNLKTRGGFKSSPKL